MPTHKADVMALVTDLSEVLNLVQYTLLIRLPLHNWFAINKVSMILPYFGMKLMSTFLHFRKFLHFDEILKTQEPLTSLVKISPPTLIINLKICAQFISNQSRQMFMFRQMSLLMCTIPQLLMARHFWNQPDKLQLLLNKLSKTRFEHFISLMTRQVVEVRPHLRRKLRLEKLQKRLMIHRKALSPD
jgi:hypothetical protein